MSAHPCRSIRHRTARSALRKLLIYRRQHLRDPIQLLQFRKTDRAFGDELLVWFKQSFCHDGYVYAVIAPSG